MSEEEDVAADDVGVGVFGALQRMGMIPVVQLSLCVPQLFVSLERRSRCPLSLEEKNQKGAGVVFFLE